MRKPNALFLPVQLNVEHLLTITQGFAALLSTENWFFQSNNSICVRR
ncbi:hypothetical protein FHS21_005329 [Phyllobacterium trifolii]|uniref:Uncharacterized protein n=1 Tax=Phyllobacterium trifolii TaxID=300193 RepID=A0A839UJU9_9HYPH|nr:hypothetical protein [Phyllobacterium trifolii]